MCFLFSLEQAQLDEMAKSMSPANRSQTKIKKLAGWTNKS